MRVSGAPGRPGAKEGRGIADHEKLPHRAAVIWSRGRATWSRLPGSRRPHVIAAPIRRSQRHGFVERRCRSEHGEHLTRSRARWSRLRYVAGSISRTPAASGPGSSTISPRMYASRCSRSRQRSIPFVQPTRTSSASSASSTALCRRARREPARDPPRTRRSPAPALHPPRRGLSVGGWRRPGTPMSASTPRRGRCRAR